MTLRKLNGLRSLRRLGVVFGSVAVLSGCLLGSPTAHREAETAKAHRG